LDENWPIRNFCAKKDFLLISIIRQNTIKKRIKNQENLRKIPKNSRKIKILNHVIFRKSGSKFQGKKGGLTFAAGRRKSRKIRKNHVIQNCLQNPIQDLIRPTL